MAPSPKHAGNQSAATRGLLSDYYTRDQLADELGITTRSLERWAWLRTGPRRTTLGNRVYYHRAAVEEWLASQTEGA